MEDFLLCVSLAIISVIVLTIIWFIQARRPKEYSSNEVEPQEVDNERPVIPQRIGGNARARMRMAHMQRQQEQQQAQVDESGDDEEPPPVDAAIPPGKVGKKKLAKLQLKADKRAKREVDERERQEKKEEEDKEWELRQIRDAKEREEEKLQKEEEERRKLEEVRKEQEEYEQFKKQFMVQEEGFDETQDKNQEETLIKDFIDHIKKSKVVVLEEMAALFKVKTQAVISRIAKLQEDGRLTGVIDDRGKFIFISIEELEEVAKFIRQRGRVSLTEIAEASNQLINLQSEITLEV